MLNTQALTLVVSEKVFSHYKPMVDIDAHDAWSVWTQAAWLAGVVLCCGPKKSPRTSSIVQIIFLFRSFEISIDIQSVQNTHA